MKNIAIKSGLSICSSSFGKEKAHRIVAASLLFAALCVPAFAKDELYSQKAMQLRKEIVNNPQTQDASVKAYVKLLSKRAKRYEFRKDCENATDDLRSILYLMRDNKGSKEYASYEKRLNKVLAKMQFDDSLSNRLEIAKNLYLEGKYFASAYEFEYLLAANNEPSVCYEYLGDISLELKNPSEAVQYYLKSLNEESKNPAANFKLAKLYDLMGEADLAQDKYSAAISNAADADMLKEITTVFEAKVAADPRNSTYYETLGQAYQELGEYAKTYPLYKKAIELNPQDMFLKYSLAALLHEMGQYNYAITIYDTILKTNPYESQIRIGKAKCLQATNRTNDAIKEYQIVLAIYPDSMSAKYGLFKILAPKNGLVNAINSFYPLNESFKPTSAFYYDFAKFLDQMGNYSYAAQAYQLSIDLNKKNSQAYLELYDLYVTQNNEAKAFEVAESAYKNIPGNAQIRQIYTTINKDADLKKNTLALSYIKNKEYSKAIMLYEQMNPKNASIYNSIANCYRMSRNFDKAIANMNSAIKMDPTNSDLYYGLAIMYVDKKDFDKAMDNIIKSVNLNKNNVKAIKLGTYVAKQNITDILNNAYAQYEKKNYTAARATLLAGQKKYPSEPQMHYYIGLTYEAQDQYAEAIEAYRKAIKADKNFDQAYFSIGQLLEKYGKGKEALEAYERYLAGESIDQDLLKKAQERVIELSKKYY